MKPQEIYELELWEFNAYIQGYNEIYYREEVMMTKQSYYTGMFSRFGNKPKPLKYYLDEIKKEFNKVDKNKPVDVNKSINIFNKIEKIKRKQNE